MSQREVPDALTDDQKRRIGRWAREKVAAGVLPPSFARSAVLERETERMLLYWQEKAEATRKAIPRDWVRAARNWLLNAARFEEWTGPGSRMMREGDAARLSEELGRPALRRVK